MPTLGVVQGFFPRAFEVVQPTAVAARPYVGVYAGSGALWAFQYLGGTYGSQLATKSLTGTGLTAADADWAILSTSPLIVAWERSGKYLVWNVTANTFAGPTTVPANASVFSSGGRDGYAYFVETNGSTYYYLDRLTTAAAVEFVTQGSDGDLATTLTGVGLSQIFWNGTKAYSVVTGTAGNAGAVESFNGQSLFTADFDWLPGDPNSDWAGWNNAPGHKVPGQAFAIGVPPNGLAAARYLAKVPTPATASVLIDGADCGGESLYQCDPSPDGITAMLRSGTKIAQVSLVTPVPPVWLAIDQATPVTDIPHAFFCLD